MDDYELAEHELTLLRQAVATLDVIERLDIERRRAVLGALLTVTVLPVPRGAPPRFDPESVTITPREQR